MRNPTNVLIRLPYSAWTQPDRIATVTGELQASPAFGSVTGALNPGGRPIPAPLLARLYRALGPPQRLARTEPPSVAARIPAAVYGAYLASAQYVSPDGRTLQFYTALRAGDPASTAALNAIPAARAQVAHAAAADRRDRERDRRRGRSGLRREPDLDRGPDPDRAARADRDRDPARGAVAQPRRACCI